MPYSSGDGAATPTDAAATGRDGDQGSSTGDTSPRDAAPGDLPDVTTTFGAAWLKPVYSSGSVDQPLIAIAPAAPFFVVAWTFRDDVDAGDGERLTFTGGDATLLAAYGGDGALLWKRHFGGKPQGAAVDAAGRVTVAGSFSGTVDFGGGPRAAGGGGGIFVASYQGADGAHRWSSAFGLDTVTEGATALAADATGDVLLAGGPNRGQDFGGGPLARPADEDAFLVRFSKDGDHLWSRSIGGDGPRANNTERIAALAVDPATANIIAAGNFNDAINLGVPLVSAGGDDVFVARLDNAGNHVWSRRFGGTAADQVQAMSLAPSGAIALVGRYLGTIDFGGGPLPVEGFDTFLVSLDSNGAHQWSRRLVTTDTAPSLGVASDGSGDIYVAGDFSQTASLGGQPIDLGSGSHVFAASYAASGPHRFSIGFGATRTTARFAIGAIGDDQVVVAGAFTDSLSLGADSLTAEAPLNGFVLLLRP